MKKFKLSEIQANAILDMPLKRLAALERKKIEDEFKALTAKIKELEGLLRSARKLRDVVAEELLEVKNQFNDRRRTQIVSLKKGETNHQRLTLADLTEAAETWVQITGDGLISRKNISTTPKFSGKLAPSLVLKADTHQTLYLVGKDGMAAAFAIHTLPEADQPGGGTLLEKATPFSDPGKLTTGFVIPREEAGLPPQYLITVTRQGLVKKSLVSDLPGPSSQMFPLVKINPGDELQSAFFTTGEDDLILITRDAAAIRFSENEVRSMGLVSAGVNGIKLQGEDYVAGSGVIRPGSQVIVLDSTGKGWRLPAEEYPRQGRYGRGVSAVKVTGEAKIINSFSDHRNRSVMVMLRKSVLQSFRMDEIELGKRTRIGLEIIRLKPGDEVERIITLATDRKLASGTSAGPKNKGKKLVKPRAGSKKAKPASEKLKNPPRQKKVVTKTRSKRKPSVSDK